MVVLNRIYTRTGDDGTTALGSGERVAKTSRRVEAYGTVDETNAAIGLARALLGEGDAVKIGAPFVSGASVKATVLAQGRADKVHIFKMRRRKHYKKSQGHRQSFTEVRIDDIVGA
jgi:large subunit ribosomal protein L21